MTGEKVEQHKYKNHDLVLPQEHVQDIIGAPEFNVKDANALKHNLDHLNNQLHKDHSLPADLNVVGVNVKNRTLMVADNVSGPEHRIYSLNEDGRVVGVFMRDGERKHDNGSTVFERLDNVGFNAPQKEVNDHFTELRHNLHRMLPKEIAAPVQAGDAFTWKIPRKIDGKEHPITVEVDFRDEVQSFKLGQIKYQRTEGNRWVREDGRVNPNLADIRFNKSDGTVEVQWQFQKPGQPGAFLDELRTYRPDGSVITVSEDKANHIKEIKVQYAFNADLSPEQASFRYHHGIIPQKGDETHVTMVNNRITEVVLPDGTTMTPDKPLGMGVPGDWVLRDNSTRTDDKRADPKRIRGTFIINSAGSIEIFNEDTGKTQILNTQGGYENIR